MDLDDLDMPAQQPARQPRFAPKSKLKKHAPPPKVEPFPSEMPPAAVVVKTEVVEVPPKPLVDEMDIDIESLSKEEEMMNSTSNVDWRATEDDVAAEEEDYVVSEYDVYFTTPDFNSQLYVMQYPLRPSWRPYELDHRCSEVRVRPTSGEMEVDMWIEKESTHYDPDSPIADKMHKQTLASPGPPHQAAAYAVGLLKGKKLYMNPIHAVVQLRPSMKYLDFCDTKKKIVKEEGSAKNAVAGSSRKQNKQNEAPKVVEPWIPLNYHSSSSELAQTYLSKMVTEEGNALQFSMNPYDYLNSLCPGAMINKMKSSELSRRSLLSQPLEERLKTVLIKGPHVQRFNTIKHLAPNDPLEDVLKIVQQHARLVQGVWVGKSCDRYKKTFEMVARDYALFLFSQNPVVKDSELDIPNIQKSMVRTLLREIAIERTNCKDWKFKEPTDDVFMKLYPDIVEHHRIQFQEEGKKLLKMINEKRAGMKRPGQSVRFDEGRGTTINDEGRGTGTNDARSDEGRGIATNEARSASTSISKEAREALTKVLGKLFLTHKVCHFQTIRQGLRDTAVSMSVLPKAGAKTSAVVAAVKDIVDAPEEELQAMISEYAVNVHGLYAVVKSSLENPELNPLRNDVIDLFRGREPGAKLKKGEIMEAAKNKPTTTEFQKVINEYCVSKGGAWVLKSGDEVSPSDWQNIFKAAKLL